jgi:hypothetical protein
MLPIHRVLPVGGVLLAILILVLALTPPDGSRGPLSSPGVPARGALSDRDRQAETRQFLIHAALKRADQLSRLRDLPDTPAHSEEPQLAGLPAERSDADPEESGSTNATPAVTIPIQIGGPSIDVPIPSPQDIPLTLKQPEQSKTQQEMRRRAQRVAKATRIVVRLNFRIVGLSSLGDHHRLRGNSGNFVTSQSSRRAVRSRIPADVCGTDCISDSRSDLAIAFGHRRVVGSRTKFEQRRQQT